MWRRLHSAQGNCASTGLASDANLTSRASVPGVAFPNALLALQNIILKFVYYRSRNVCEKFKLKHSLTFGELSKIFSWNLCIAEIELLVRNSSWNFVYVPTAMYKVSAWYSHNHCDFWHCMFSRDYLVSSWNVSETIPWIFARHYVTGWIRDARVAFPIWYGNMVARSLAWRGDLTSQHVNRDFDSTFINMTMDCLRNLWHQTRGYRKLSTSHRKLWDIITYPCPGYLLLASKSSFNTAITRICSRICIGCYHRCWCRLDHVIREWYTMS